MESLLYVALGDSITRGSNVLHEFRFPSILGRIIEQQTLQPVYTLNMGKNGLTSSGLLKMLRSPSALDSISQANIVTVDIGGDDLIHAYVKMALFRNSSLINKALDRLHDNLGHICHTLAKIGPSNTLIATIYNPFPFTPLARDVVQFAGERIIRPTAARFGFPVVDLYRLFLGREHKLIDRYRNGRLEDYRPFTPKTPIHPNAQGYEAIAHAFAEKIV